MQRRSIVEDIKHWKSLKSLIAFRLKSDLRYFPYIDNC